MIEEIRKDPEIYGLDRWQSIRCNLLQKLKYADAYLSIAYVKAKDGKSRYWASPSEIPSRKEPETLGLTRRVVIFGPGVNHETLFEFKNSTETMADWLRAQHDAGIDVLTKEADVVRSEVGPRVLPCLETKRLFKLIRTTRGVEESEVSRAVNEDFPIMDIGIYGERAVGCQITDECGKSVAFVLSRQRGDIKMARRYFNIVCRKAKRFSHDALGTGIHGLLHPRIEAKAFHQFQNRNYREAVLNSVMAVFQLIRERTNLDLDGCDLAAKVFSLGNPMLKISDLTTTDGRNKQQGFMQLLQGTYTGIRNPLAHDISTGPSDEAEAKQLLIFASLLARTVEAAEPCSGVARTRHSRRSNFTGA